MSSSVSEGGTATAAMWRNLISTQAIPFVGVGSAGEDIYQVRAENGSAEVRLDLLEDGRIRSVAAGAGVTNAYPLPLTSLASREGNIPLRASQGTVVPAPDDADCNSRSRPQPASLPTIRTTGNL